MAESESITITGAGKSVTVSSEQWGRAATQLDLFPVDKKICAAFLTQVLTLEDEFDRLREELQDIVQEYQEQLPLRAVRVAIKIVRARKKLAEHHKEPMGYTSQEKLEAFVAEEMARLDAAKQQAAEEAERSTRAVPDMTGGG